MRVVVVEAVREFVGIIRSVLLAQYVGVAILGGVFVVAGGFRFLLLMVFLGEYLRSRNRQSPDDVRHESAFLVGGFHWRFLCQRFVGLDLEGLGQCFFGYFFLGISMGSQSIAGDCGGFLWSV